MKDIIEYTIKTDRNTGEIVFSRGDYSFKQWGLRHEIIDLIEYLQQENKQLKDNWNKLKDYLKETVNSDCYSPYDGYDWQYILDKMQELEKGDSNE